MKAEAFRECVGNGSTSLILRVYCKVSEPATAPMVEVAVRTALRFLADLRLLRLCAHLESPIETLEPLLH